MKNLTTITDFKTETNIFNRFSMPNPTTPMRTAKRVAKKRVPTDDVPLIYKAGSQYQLIFSILYSHRHTGITRERLLKIVMAKSKREEKLCMYSCNIVSSPESCENGGGGHKSSRADAYWIEKGCGGFLRLHMR